MDKNLKGEFYGITPEDEAKKYAQIMGLSKQEVLKIKAEIRKLAGELEELRDVYDPDEKEGIAQWVNTDARFGQVRKDLKRAERNVKKPYFGRIDIVDGESERRETYYIGKTVLAENNAEPIVIDWRAPVSSVYYDHSLGECTYKVPKEGYFKVDLQRKRTYEIDETRLIDYYDSDVVANDDLLTKYLSKSKRNVLSEIIATIQDEQNKIIRRNPKHNMLVQGSAGSGKTTVAMHRISYILYNYDLEFKPEDFYIIGSNKVLLDYITGVLPDLDVYGVRQMTMADLFIRLLYEDWGINKYKVRQIDKKTPGISMKAGKEWFDKLSTFSIDIEKKQIPCDDIIIPKTGNVILTSGDIKKVLDDLADRPMIQKIERLNDLIMSGLETELYGRYYSYNSEEQKKLTHHYKNYFNKFFYKKSVFDLYEQFMNQRLAENPDVSYIPGEPDLYDLASLAYLYKKIKEVEVIQEASHVVIDEAQDFGIMAYISLKYCMSKCTFTIMGDVAQNINFETGLGDWEELKQVMLPDKYDYFGLLRKSYRNTVEISKFATDILRHANFPIYPVEPIVRHGEKVDIARASSIDGLNRLVADKIGRFKLAGYETIAVICKDATEAKEAFESLKVQTFRKEKISGLRLFANDNIVNNDEEAVNNSLNEDEKSGFGNGVLILPIEYAKGLEFDAVIIYNAGEEAYPYEDNYAKLLYVAATRALHELSVFYTEELTGLIREPIPEGREEINFAEDDFHEDPYEFEEEFKSKETLAKESAELGDVVIKDRDTFGPRRIEKVLAKKQEDKEKELLEKQERERIARERKILEQKTFYQKQTAKSVRDRNSVLQKSAPKVDLGTRANGFGQQIGTKKDRLIRDISGNGSNTDIGKKLSALNSIGTESNKPGTSAYKGVSKKQTEGDELSKTETATEYGTMPMGTSIQPVGHGRVDFSVKWINKDKKCIDIVSFYGTLRIIPISDDTVRIMFFKTEAFTPKKMPSDIKTGPFKYTLRESREAVELELAKLKIRVEKRNGIISFMNSQGNLILTEKADCPRQYHEREDIWWQYFDFSKKENISSRGSADDVWDSFDNSVRYISHGSNQRASIVMSSKGYQILVPAGIRSMLCTIPAYGPYISFEGAGGIDYFIRSAR
ncbi:MAG: ATP-binding domain-containing protein [Lachnospiraceae bacterium]|nr:ATP-binding domain-containing protein [Lachnospiraceae bacterium]